MHVDELLSDEGLVRRLLAEQHPRWAGLPLRLVDSYGTDHDVYRLGEDLSVRLPRVAGASRQAELEARWLPRLAPHLALAVPVPVAVGRPGAGYPYPWSVCRWLPGTNAHTGLTDLGTAAEDLADFVRALRSVPTDGAEPRTPGSKGGPLAEHDEVVRRSLADLGGRVDGAAVLRRWERCVQAPGRSGAPSWVHGDLMPGNLLVVAGRLSAVIDWGSLKVADPACDLVPAWHLLDVPARARFAAALEVDEASWWRAAGWVLVQAVVALAYYWDTNPGMVAQAGRALEAVLTDRTLD